MSGKLTVEAKLMRTLAGEFSPLKIMDSILSTYVTGDWPCKKSTLVASISDEAYSKIENIVIEKLKTPADAGSEER